MQTGKDFVRHLGGTVVSSESFAVLHDTDGSISTDPANQLQFGGVAAVQIEDCIFLDMLRSEAPSD